MNEIISDLYDQFQRDFKQKQFFDCRDKLTKFFFLLFACCRLRTFFSFVSKLFENFEKSTKILKLVSDRILCEKNENFNFFLQQ